MKYLEIIKERLGYKDIMNQSEQNLQHTFGFELEIAIEDGQLENVFQNIDTEEYIKSTFHFEQPDTNDFFEYLFNYLDIDEALTKLKAEPKHDWVDDNKENFYTDQNHTNELSIEDIDQDNLRKFFNITKISNLKIYKTFIEYAEENQFEDYRNNFDMFEYFNNNMNPLEKNELIVNYVAGIFKRKFNYPVKIFYTHNNSSKTHDVWNIEPDGSITPIGAEIVSPVFNNINEGIKPLMEMFNFIINNSTFSTNDSTGLHINIGVPNNIDLLKLFLFLGDSHILNQFNRADNEFAMNIFPKIYQFLNDNDLTNYQKMITRVNYEIMNLFLKDENSKYFSVNIRKIKQGFLEFRIIGGQDYHLKNDEIIQTIMRYNKVIEIASNENLERKTYLNKLYKMTKNKDEYVKPANIRPKGTSLVDLGVISQKDYGNIHGYFYDNFRFLDKTLINTIDYGSKDAGAKLISAILLWGMDINIEILKILIKITRYYKLTKSEIMKINKRVYDEENPNSKQTFEEYFKQCLTKNVKILFDYSI